jgi:hypothetical protein
MARRNNAIVGSPPSANASYYANMFCYKRITPLLIPPGLTLLLPPIISLGVTSLNKFSRGYGTCCLLSSIVITRSVYSLVRKYAPSPEKLAQAHEKMRYRLFLTVLILVCFFVRMTSICFGFKENSLSAASVFHFSFGTRYALGMAILSATVALRFVTKSGIGE